MLDHFKVFFFFFTLKCKTPFCEGLSEVGNDTQVGLTLVLNLSMAHCRSHLDILRARNSGLFRLDISLLHPFILVQGNLNFSSAKLSDHKSHQLTRLPCIRAILIWVNVACLTSSRTSAVFLLVVYIWFVLPLPLKPKPLYSFIVLCRLGLVCKHFTASTTTGCMYIHLNMICNSLL